jgi:hypothetical protein
MRLRVLDTHRSAARTDADVVDAVDAVDAVILAGN